MLSLPSLPGDGNNRRQNCFGDFFRWRNEGPENFQSFAFVVAHSVTSDMHLLTGEIVVLFHVLSDVDTETFYCMACRGTHTTQMGKKKHLILPSMSHSNNSRRSKNICILFHNHLWRAHSQGVFAFHITELLLYTFYPG